MQTELKLENCPFCGCKMHLRSNRDWHYLEGEHDDNCVFERDIETRIVPATDEYREWIVDTWNRRAGSDAVPEALKLAKSAFVEADQLAILAERLLKAINKEFSARERRELDETANNVLEHEQAEQDVSEHWRGVRDALYEYRRRADRFRHAIAAPVDEELPELPKPTYTDLSTTHHYTEDQMREYARAALATAAGGKSARLAEAVRELLACDTETASISDMTCLAVVHNMSAGEGAKRQAAAILNARKALREYEKG